MECKANFLARAVLIAVVVCSVLDVNAQKTKVYSYPDKTFKKGLDLFNKQKYASAQEYFEQVLEFYGGNVSLVRMDAAYYNSICAIELFNKDAEFLVNEFLKLYPESPKTPYAYFNMGKLKYREEKYAEATEWFGCLERSQLADSDGPEMLFKKGYSYYQTGDTGKASICFRTIKDSANDYRSPAMYYYSHIEYVKRNLETAYQGFLSLKDDETFSPVVPYYITQILFIQKKYAEVIDYATPLLDSASVNRATEMARILGESNYRLAYFDKALPMFERYFQQAKNISKDDNYQMGYLYYRTSQWGKAVEFLSKVTGENDTLAQNAYYHLADCYVRLGEKEKAKNAFAAAAKINVDMQVKQDAAFSLAKITYELSYSPFNETITTFQQYINDYPGSDKIDEAYSYLVKVFMTTKNYKDALESLEKIKNRNSEMNLAYQRIAFYRGLELYNNLDFEGAKVLFSKSLTYEVFDKNISALAYFWRGDAQYRLQLFENARKDFQDFLLMPGALGKNEFNMAHYNLGYTYFNLKNYGEAALWFRKYIDTRGIEQNRIFSDACIRVGDSYFMQKNYDQALKFYDIALAVAQVDADYAMFQKALCSGLVKRREAKIEMMNKLIAQYPSSSYIDDAVYEIAETYCAMDQHVKAVPFYERVIRDYPNSSYMKNSLLQLGLIYFNTDQNDKALDVYKHFVADYKGSPDARNALQGIKNIYIEKNDIDTYMAYVETLGGIVTVSQSGQDSLSYLAGEDAYMKDNCAKSIKVFEGYIKKFPDGIFLLNALYYKAECHLKTFDYDSASMCYNRIIDKPKNAYTEIALVNNAKIQMRVKNYQEALKNYKRLEEVAEYKSNLLESRIGLMRCNQKLNNNEGLILSCEKLLITDKIPDELVREATFNQAKAYLAISDTAKALEKFRTVAIDIKSIEGAESKFCVSDILLKQGKADESESEVLDFLDKNSPHQYWMARSYILWGDIFEVRKDLFQAKNTYHSILENYVIKSDGIIDLAQQKLDKIQELESSVISVPDKPDEVELKN